MSERTVSPHDIRFLARDSAEKLWVIRRRCERYWGDVRRFSNNLQSPPHYGRRAKTWGREDANTPEADVDWLIQIIDELLILHQSREQRLADSEHKRRELERGRP